MEGLQDPTIHRTSCCFPFESRLLFVDMVSERTCFFVYLSGMLCLFPGFVCHPCCDEVYFCWHVVSVVCFVFVLIGRVLICSAVFSTKCSYLVSCVVSPYEEWLAATFWVVFIYFVVFCVCNLAS